MSGLEPLSTFWNTPPISYSVLVALWRLRYKLSLRDLDELFLERSFGSFASASRFCRAFDEVRQYFRARTTMKQKISLAKQHEVFRQRQDTSMVMVPMV
jgi:hypothetical protein